MTVSRELYRDRKNKKLCTICGEPAQKDRLLCDKHATKNLEGQRNIAKKRIKQGLCVMCGKCPPVSRRKRCRQCLEAKKLDSKLNRAPLIQKRIKNGLCVSCGKPNPTSNKHCSMCSEKYNMSSRLKDKQKIIDNLCTKCGKNPPQTNRNKCPLCLEKGRQRNHKPENLHKRRDKHREVRDQIIKHYGGKCNCCDETERTFLAIDHVNNNGSIHRREVQKSSGLGFFQWIVNQNFPDDLQILCHNCNMSKYLSSGICAHKNKINGV